jgi:Tol biopolymer transport system component
MFGSHTCCAGPNNLWLVHPNGSGRHRITTNPGHQFVWLSSSFSPDGSMIVAGRRPADESAGNADVYVMNVDGSSFTNITLSAGYDSDPDWGPRKT